MREPIEKVFFTVNMMTAWQVILCAVIINPLGLTKTMIYRVRRINSVNAVIMPLAINVREQRRARESLTHYTSHLEL